MNRRATVGAPFTSGGRGTWDSRGSRAPGGPCGLRSSSGSRRYGLVSGFGGRYGAPGVYGPEEEAEVS